MTIRELFDTQIKPLPARDKLQVAQWILAALDDDATADDDARPLVEYRPSGKTPYQILKEIAELPSEGVDDGFSGADHDLVLYGQGYGA